LSRLKRDPEIGASDREFLNGDREIIRPKDFFVNSLVYNWGAPQFIALCEWGSTASGALARGF
jgi:hypothetical protein